MKPMILIIEDDLSYLRRVRRELEQEGYEVLGTADGIEGLSLAREHGSYALYVKDDRRHRAGSVLRW